MLNSFKSFFSSLSNYNFTYSTDCDSISALSISLEERDQDSN